jgi:YD repeat-containing protein
VNDGHNFQVGYSYDEVGNRTQLIYPGGNKVVTYTYDGANRLITVTNWHTPNGEVLASASGDKTVRLWRVSDGELLHALEGHKDEVVGLAIAFSPDGEMLAAAGYKKRLRLW